MSKFVLSILPEARPTINCFQALDYLCAHSLNPTTLDSGADSHFSQTGRAHLLLVSNTPGLAGGAIGVITLEGMSRIEYCRGICDNEWTYTDIIEEIISEEIVDETDQYEDNQSKRRAKRMTTAAVMRGCVFLLFPTLVMIIVATI